MIKQITIRNFKSLGDVTVDLEPTTVLIGRSGVGKSNLLRAIRFLRNFLINGNAAVDAEGGWWRIFPFGMPKPVTIEVKYAIPGFADKFCYRLRWEQVPNSPGQVVLKEERLEYGQNEIIKSLAGPHEWLQQLKLGNLPTKTEAVLSFAALTGGIGWHDFPADTLIVEPQPQDNPSGQIQKGLGDSASNFLEVLRDLTQDLKDQNARRQIIARLEQVNPSVASVELNSILQPQAVIVGHRLTNAVIPLDLSQESDGFRRYLAHLLAIYQTPSKQFLMFEEPENGISPGVLSTLAEEFNSAPMSGRGHILISTQSPDLLDGFTPSQIRVVDLDANTQLTKIGPLDPEQVEAVRDQLLKPGELLTVDQARLKPEKAIAS